MSESFLLSTSIELWFVVSVLYVARLELRTYVFVDTRLVSTNKGKRKDAMQTYTQVYCTLFSIILILICGHVIASKFNVGFKSWHRRVDDE